MAKYVYPAVFTEENCGYSVNFPNLPNCFTSGQTLEEAIEMAADVLCLTLYEMEQRGDAIPSPVGRQSISLEANEFVNFITCDTVEYRKYL